MTEVREISVTLPHAAFSSADWADAYRVVPEKQFQSARKAGEAIMGAFPRWTYPMLALRQMLVTPFGLKGPGDGDDNAQGLIGIFPVCFESQSELVAGLDDKHLDFRLVITIEPADQGDGSQSVTLTTLIRRHNFLGKVYLWLVLPFHRAIIKGALRGV